MRKVVLTLEEKYKYDIIKKLVETNGNKERARIKLGFKNIRQVYRLINGYAFRNAGDGKFIHAHG